jgi:Tfp pilus assembly protein PilX
MIRSKRHQRGAVLLVGLILLMIITLFVVSSAKLTSSDLRVVGNFQSKMEIGQSTQQAIEEVLSNLSNFSTPVAQTITVNGIQVAVSAPTCLGTSPAPGYTAVNNISLYDTNWSVVATATDPITGATSTINQGVRIRLPTNFCP